MDTNLRSQDLPFRWVRCRKSHQSGAVRGVWDLILHAAGNVASRTQERAAAEEVDLVRLMGSPNSDATQEIYKRYSERLFRFIYRRIGEKIEDAEEITLDTFLSAADLAKSFAGKSSVFVWLCGIAKLRIIDFHRRVSSAKRTCPETQTSLDALDEDSLSESHFGSRGITDVLDKLLASEVVDAALSRLNDDEREALLLRYVEGLSVREIALLMKRTEKAVESLLTRAKAKPRDFLLRMLGEEGRS